MASRADEPTKPNDAPSFEPSKGSTQKGKRRTNTKGKSQQGPRLPKFEGKCEALKGHIYDCDPRQADMYTKTTKEIAEYVGREYKYGSDVRLSIETMAEVTIPEPQDPPPNATRSQERMK